MPSSRPRWLPCGRGRRRHEGCYQKERACRAMKIYLAARYERRALLRRWAKRLHQAGHIVVSSWLHRRVPRYWRTLTWWWQECAPFAAACDIKDLQSAECLILYNPAGERPSAGRQIEFGIALASKIPILLIGERPSVFHHHPLVTPVRSFRAAEIVLRRWTNGLYRYGNE